MPNYRSSVASLPKSARWKPFYLPNSCAQYGHIDPKVFASPSVINVFVHAKSGRKDECNDPLLVLSELQNNLNMLEHARCNTTNVPLAAQCMGQPMRAFRVFDMNVRGL